uniref:Uncharacterized protein n=1 Tax=Nelumbo nucifera TaxID=4432 RepID=A0A822XUK3_NELNU|nr:TPA_asm: hypothetical protein HUJ06_024049 [Nelumbo nucifera]
MRNLNYSFFLPYLFCVKVNFFIHTIVDIASLLVHWTAVHPEFEGVNRAASGSNFWLILKYFSSLL